ncbi:MAG: peptide ABC transporter substrate-binding protein [Polyangiaceae bacterium]
MRSGVRALFLAASLAMISSGCGESASPYYGTTKRTGKSVSTFYVNAGVEPEVIDPGRAAEAVGTMLAGHMFEGLATYDPVDAHPTQGVATAWDKSDDNRLFRFHLRKEALWSDGKTVTAHDFAFAWGRVLRPSLASRTAAVLYVLLNGELYQRGQLKVTKGSTGVVGAPADNAAPVTTVAAGAAVRILKTEGEYSQIALHRRLPTFDASRPPEPEEAKPAPLGWVPSSALEESPSVLGVRAVDDETLEIEAEHPTPYLLDLTCYSALSPMRRDVVEPLESAGKVDDLNRPENVVGNGAYRIVDWKFRYEIAMEKNPRYWRADKLKIDRIVWMMLEDYRSTLNLYKAGDLDYIGDNASIPPETMPFVETKKDFRRSYYLAVAFYSLNTKKPPLDDVRVRRALNLGLDKQQLVDRVTRSGQIPATHYVPDFTGSGYADVAKADKAAGTDPFSGPGMDFDPERARALLREAGYEIDKDGEDYKVRKFPPLEILYNTNEGNRAIAVAIQSFWRKHLGIQVAVRNEEWKVMLKNIQEGSFQIGRGGWIAEYNHPETWLDTFLSFSPQNQTGWGDPEFDRTMKEAAQTADPTESIRKFRVAEKIAVDAMVKIPLYFYTRNVLIKPWVRGFHPNPRNTHHAQWLWIDETGAAKEEPAMPPLDFAPPGPFAPKAAPPGEAP